MESIKRIYYFCKMDKHERICNIYNKLIQYLIQPGQPNSSLSKLELNYYNGVFVLNYHINRKYANPDILYRGVLDETDRLLDWYDLTPLGDSFKIIIQYPFGESYIFENYYDLMEIIFKLRYDPFSYTVVGHPFSSHPRGKQFIEYRNHKDTLKKQKVLQKFYEWEPVWEPITGLYKNDETSFFGKIKNKLVDLLHV